jgi:DNA-binding response OmpR family regulator
MADLRLSGINRQQFSARLDHRTVLIVDDDRNLTRLVTTVLGLAGFEVLTAGDGEAALGVLADRNVDLVILDLLMPRMDGRTFYKEFRARGNSTPVLIASAFGARAAQHELGAEGAVEKPFDPDALLDAIDSVLK